MKKIVLMLFALVSLVVLPSTLKADDKPISFAQLPKVAQQFVKQHFSAQVSLVTVDNDLIGKTYEVLLVDGTRMEFDRKGVWKDVEVERGSVVPNQIIPKAISTYVVKHFPGTTIKQIEKRDRGGYQVELSNGVELKFNSKLAFVGIDD
ncbi:PepSY-like domain-containing protein [Porphyromonas circumdentaria]|uniref:PepSY-like domain-containing protein n=1 Tax=Porphyromonas circumdentaria TaxID=29524 RepID=UPI0026DB0884|nr:PepSY-like domain-containing protein [Porphyromonas circumdentaria]MDO4721823.1 PepSY-like domain-containing protein [Porphyromonas circumdentaria]